MKDGMLYNRPLLKAELVAYFLGRRAAREEFELGCGSVKLHRGKSGLRDFPLTLLQLNETQTGGGVKSHSSDNWILN